MTSDTSSLHEAEIPLSRLQEVAVAAADDPTLSYRLGVDLEYGDLATRVPLDLTVQTRHPWIDPAGDQDGRGPIVHMAAFTIPQEWPYVEIESGAEVRALYDRLGLTTDVGGQPAVARLEIYEVVGHIHAPRYGWFDSLDPHSQTLAELGEWLESALARPTNIFPEGVWPMQDVGGGAVFYPQEMFVHPGAQGQELGAQLLGRVLRYLGRSIHDLCVMQPVAIPNRLDPGIDLEAAQEAHEPEVTEGLIGYYQRLGFTVDSRYREETGVCWMYRSFNLYEGDPYYWDLASP